MPAIVTSDFRILNTANFKADIEDPNNSVYIFVGKGDAWNPVIDNQLDNPADIPLDTQYDLTRAYTNMAAAKLVSATDVTHAIPRYNWTSGIAYTPWDSNDEDIYSKQFYAVTAELKVYKCLVAGPGVSTQQPTQTAVAPVQEGDGYVWKYMYTLSAADAARFLSNFYLPVKTVKIPAGGTINDLNEADQIQFTNQQNSAATIGGSIFRVKVLTGGSGYTSAPTVTINGDGTGFTATAVLTGDTVTAINVTNAGNDYNVANIILTGGGGTGATAEAVLSPGLGHGTDPVKELGSKYISLNVTFDGDEGQGDFVVDNEFRQIGVVRNPYNFGTTTIATDTTLRALYQMNMSAHTGFSVDDVITGTTSGAIAYIDSYDVDTGQIRYHFNEKTGYIQFEAGESITSNTGGTGTIGTFTNPEIQPFSGDILFIENREPVDRDAQQIEDVKLIIEF